MMKRNRLFSLGVVAVLLLVAIFSHPSEPTYQDESLSYWFKQWARQSNSFAPPPEAFRKLGSQAVPYLVGALKKRESRFNRFHLYVYDALPEFVQKPLRQPVRASFIRWKAARALLDIGSDGEAALPALVDALQDPESRVRYTALNAIVAVGPAAGRVTPDLVTALESRDRWFRYALAEAIIKLDSYPRDTVQQIAQALIDIIKSMESTSGQALATLQRIKPTTEEIFMALADAVQEQDKQLVMRGKLHQPTVVGIRSNTFVTLVKFAQENAFAAHLLSEKLEDPDMIVRAIAAECIAGVMPFPEPVQPKLAALLRETNSLVRVQAAFALHTLDPSLTHAVVEPVLDGLIDSNVEIQRRAAHALEMMGSSKIPTIAELLGRKEGAAKAKASMALTRFTPAMASEVLSFSFRRPML